MPENDAPDPQGEKKPQAKRRRRPAPKKRAAAAPAPTDADEAASGPATPDPATAGATHAGDAADAPVQVTGEAVEEPTRSIAGPGQEPPAAAKPASGDATAVTRVLRPVRRALTSQRAPRLRRWLALGLVVMSVIALVVSALALWSDSLVFNTDKWVATVAPVAEDPAVRHAVSTFVADKTIEVADLQDRIADALPSDAAVLAVPLTRTLRDFLVQEIDKLLATEDRPGHLGGRQSLRPRAAHRGPAGREQIRLGRRERRHPQPAAADRGGAAAPRSPDTQAARQGRAASADRPEDRARADPHASAGRHRQGIAGRLRQGDAPPRAVRATRRSARSACCAPW